MGLFLAIPASPIKPTPSSRIVPGSGTGAAPEFARSRFEIVAVVPISKSLDSRPKAKLTAEP